MNNPLIKSLVLKDFVMVFPVNARDTYTSKMSEVCEFGIIYYKGIDTYSAW